MKKIFLSILVILFISCNSTDGKKSENQDLKAALELKEQGDVTKTVKRTPFSKGVNFSGWFESFSAQSIPFTKYTEEDFANAKSLGVDVIRLPIRMHSMTSGAPNYTLDPLLIKFLNSAVNWAEKYQIYLIIDNHSFDPVAPTSPDIDKILVPVWSQIARLYRDRSNFIIYEILNEPHGISDARWGEIQSLAIQAIRQHDKKHAIIVGGTDYNSLSKLESIPKYEDSNLIYTFHFYDPYLFTHQGASWGEPPVLTNLAGVPFPPDISRMPRIHPELKGTWIESSLAHSYIADALPRTLSQTLDKAVKFSLERDVPVFCGEFGVFMINSKPQDRVRWYSYVTSALDNRGISRTSWDYYGGFGIFNSEIGDFNHDLNVNVVLALGFTPPAQIPRESVPLSEGFIIYDDYPNHRHVTAGYWGEDTDFSLYDSRAAQGEFAIRWGNASQYNVFAFYLRNTSGDLSALVNDYALEFKAHTDKPASFDVRFVNKESASSIPWRMRYTINEKNLPANGRWNTIKIPLSEMSEHGAWVNAKQQWVGPKGEFSWKNVSQLEFVSEHSDLKGISILFDDIRIVKK